MLYNAIYGSYQYSVYIYILLIISTLSIAIEQGTGSSMHLAWLKDYRLVVRLPKAKLSSPLSRDSHG